MLRSEKRCLVFDVSGLIMRLVALASLLLAFPLAADALSEITPKNLTPDGFPDPADRKLITLYLAQSSLPSAANYAVVEFRRANGTPDEWFLVRASATKWFWSTLAFYDARRSWHEATAGSLWHYAPTKVEMIRARHFLSLPEKDSIDKTTLLRATPPRQAPPVKVIVSGHRIEVLQEGQTIVDPAKIEWWAEFPHIRK